MKTHTCRWCPKLATGTWRGLGHPSLPPTGAIYSCEDHEEDAYQIARPYPERESKLIEQPAGLF